MEVMRVPVAISSHVLPFLIRFFELNSIRPAYLARLEPQLIANMLQAADYLDVCTETKLQLAKPLAIALDSSDKNEKNRNTVKRPFDLDLVTHVSSWSGISIKNNKHPKTI